MHDLSLGAPPPGAAGTRDDAFLRLHLAIAEVLRLDELGRLLPEIRRAIGGSAAILYQFEGAGSPRLEVADVSATSAYGFEHFVTDPIHAAKRPLPAQLQVVPGSRLVDRGRHRSTAAYADFYAPNDAEFLASAWLTPARYAQPGMVGLLLARPPNAGDFGPDELEAFGRLVPALAAATARCRRFEELDTRRRALEALVACGPDPALVFDAFGHLLLASPSAEALLGSALARGGSGLPPAIMDEARRVGALARYEPVTPRFQARVGELEAELSIARDDLGAPLVLCRLRRMPVDPVAWIAARCGLTRAEADVLALLAEGLSNDEIARRRFVSLETTRTHVKRTLAKLDVRTRAQAAALVGQVRARRS